VLINALALHRAHDAARVFLENLIRGLPEAWPRAEVTVVVASAESLPEDAPEVRIEVIPSAKSGITRVASEQLALPRLVRRLRPDVLINPNESIPPRVDSPIVVVSQNLLFHCPSVGPPDVGPLSKRLRSRAQFAFYRRQMPRAYRRAAAVVPVSSHAAQELERHAGLDRSRAHVVHYGADRLHVKPRTGDPGTRRLLIVGALAHYKRLLEAVAALRVLREHGGDYELHLAGGAWPGYEEVVRSAAARAALSEHVKILGPLAGEQVAAAFATCHAGLALSRCESFGIPVVEGMRAGLPHVVADEPWSAETVGNAAIRVDASDPAAIAAGVKQLEDTGEWKRRSEHGKEAVRKYTWEANATGIARVAAHVASNGGTVQSDAETAEDRATMVQ
jgi:glycosyltransferase involved in cell wall biosynthesis